MRDSLFPDEITFAADALKGGAEWQAVRMMYSDVAPAAMDRFKDHLIDLAGLKKAPPAPASKVAPKKSSDPLE